MRKVNPILVESRLRTMHVETLLVTLNPFVTGIALHGRFDAWDYTLPISAGPAEQNSRTVPEQLLVVIGFLQRPSRFPGEPIYSICGAGASNTPAT